MFDNDCLAKATDSVLHCREPCSILTTQNPDSYRNYSPRRIYERIRFGDRASVSRDSIPPSATARENGSILRSAISLQRSIRSGTRTCTLVSMASLVVKLPLGNVRWSEGCYAAVVFPQRLSDLNETGVSVQLIVPAGLAG